MLKNFHHNFYFEAQFSTIHKGSKPYSYFHESLFVKTIIRFMMGKKNHLRLNFRYKLNFMTMKKL